MTQGQRWLAFGAIFLAFGIIVKLLQPILAPFLIAALLAYLVDPAVDYGQSLGMRRIFAVALVFLLTLTVVFTAVFLLLPIIGQQLDKAAGRLPDIINWLQNEVIPWLNQYLGASGHSLSLAALQQSIGLHWEKMSDLVVSVMSHISHSGLRFAGWLANLVLIPVVGFYLLKDWDKIIKHCHDLIPRDWEPTVVSLATESNQVLGAFVRGQLTIMAALGLIYSTGLWLAGLELALFIGVLAGAASLVPYLGFLLGLLMGLIAAWLQFHSWLSMFWVLCAFLVGQALENTILVPVLLGDKIGLHPVLVIFCIMAGGQLFGFTGVLLALPTTAVIMVVLRHCRTQYKNSYLYG